MESVEVGIQAQLHVRYIYVDMNKNTWGIYKKVRDQLEKAFQTGIVVTKNLISAKAKKLL